MGKCSPRFLATVVEKHAGRRCSGRSHLYRRNILMVASTSSKDYRHPAVYSKDHKLIGLQAERYTSKICSIVPALALSQTLGLYQPLLLRSKCSPKEGSSQHSLKEPTSSFMAWVTYQMTCACKQQHTLRVSTCSRFSFVQ